MQSPRTCVWLATVSRARIRGSPPPPLPRLPCLESRNTSPGSRIVRTYHGVFHPLPGCWLIRRFQVSIFRRFRRQTEHAKNRARHRVVLAHQVKNVPAPSIAGTRHGQPEDCSSNATPVIAEAKWRYNPRVNAWCDMRYAACRR